MSSLCPLGPDSLLKEVDDCWDAVVKTPEELLQLIAVQGILRDVPIHLPPLLQVFELKHN